MLLAFIWRKMGRLTPPAPVFTPSPCFGCCLGFTGPPCGCAVFVALFCACAGISADGVGSTSVFFPVCPAFRVACVFCAVAIMAFGLLCVLAVVFPRESGANGDAVKSFFFFAILVSSYEKKTGRGSPRPARLTHPSYFLRICFAKADMRFARYIPDFAAAALQVQAAPASCRSPQGYSPESA